MRKIAAIAAALVLVAAPASAQAPAQAPPGAVLVQAYVYDGMSWSPVPGGIAIPPVACNPT